MATIEYRLTKLEALADHRQGGAVIVSLTDGTRQRMTLADVVPLLQRGQVQAIDGTGGPGQGRLFELVRDLLPGVEV